MISVRSEVQIFPGPPVFTRAAQRKTARRRLAKAGCAGCCELRPASQPTPTGRGHSSVGRAPALQAGGRRFDPVWLHQPSWRNAAAVGGARRGPPWLSARWLRCLRLPLSSSTRCGEGGLSAGEKLVREKINQCAFRFERLRSGRRRASCLTS